MVQELILRPHVIRYRRERWITPDGRTVVAALPAGTVGHFGPELRRFVLAQYHPGQVTVPRIVAHLRDLGMAISKRQVVRLLIAGKEDFLAEAAGVLKSGLESAAWITVDDTGARYKGMNGACTHIGNTDFAWFATTRAKSRLNFLALLRAGATDYVINDEALAYMRGRSLSGLVIARLAGHKSKGSIIESYASPCYGGGEAGPVIGAGGEANEVEPAQVVVEIACGDATARTQEVLQPAVAAVHRLHMQIAPNPFPHRAVECFVAHPERCGARGVARATVGDQQGVLRDHRVEGSRERRRIDPGQHRADRRSAPVRRHENRYLLAREAALLRLAAPPPCLAPQPGARPSGSPGRRSRPLPRSP